MDPIEAGRTAARNLLPAILEASKEWEFRTFRCGTTPPSGYRKEGVELFRRECNREVGKALEREWPDRVVDYRRADMVIVVRADKGSVDFEPRPLWVMGRYTKAVRDLPQTPHHCRRCRGKGCPDCGDSGREVPGSVAEFVVPALEESAGARDGTFSGCGREDIDVRMLGEGRPFVVRLEHPRKRTIDLEACAAAADEAAGGAATFVLMRTCSREDAQLLTTTHPPKSYRARVEVEGGAVARDAAAVEQAFAGTIIGQRTPVRVARRRADKVRRRRVHAVTAAVTTDGHLEVEVRCEGGTYVKEWISGDSGRTEPSVASVLGRRATCVELDVLAVEWNMGTAPDLESNP